MGLALLLASLSMISPLSIDIFFPSFPAIAAEFHLSHWEVQQIITAYLAPFAVFSLVHGPLSDALGRRRVVIGGILLYTVGAIGSVFAPSFALLLACRALQGTAAGIGPTVARAVVRDLYDGVHAQRLMSTIMLVFSIAPAVAPVLGGWLHVTLGWRSVFGFMVVMGAVLSAVCWYRLPETHPIANRTPFKVGALARGCWRIGTQSEFLMLAIASALAFASIIIYIGSAPAIVLGQWHLRETQFYYLFVPVIGGFMVASLVSRRIAGRVGRVPQVKAGFMLIIGSAVSAVLSQWLMTDAPLLLEQFLLFVLAFGAQLVFPLLFLDMLDMHPEARGTAASVQSFVALGIGTIMMGVVAPAVNGSMPQLSIVSLSCSVIGFFSWRGAVALQHRRLQAPTPATGDHGHP
jgi:MFS transporter, DHA1 family, multidrug resistance protein